MIGWKAKAGYIKLVDYDTPPTNISQMIVTDDNSFGVILNTNTYSADESGSGLPNYNTIVSYLERDLKDDYYYLYALPGYNYGGDVINPFVDDTTNSIKSILEYCAPSLYLGCPNLWSFYYDIFSHNNADRFLYLFCMYYYNINRLITFGAFVNGSVGYVKVYNVFPDGNLSLLTGNSFGYGTFTGAQSRQYISNTSTPGYASGINAICTYNYKNGDSLNTRSKFKCLSFNIQSNTSSGYVRWSYRLFDPDYNNTISDVFFQKFFTDDIKPDFENELPPPPDPLDPIGPSGPGGGGGNFDQNSDIISDSSLPTISAADTGFTRIYSPTLSQVQDLAQYLWTDETVVETIWNKIKQLLENPMDAIISFSLVPVPVQISGTKNFALAYIDTGVQMNTVANQFVDVDCGTFELKEYYGSALDYSPNTKVSCFLPFIGVVTLNTDEVMNTTLNVKYRVDIVSGSCVAKVFINGSCLYQFSGHCSIPIPISAADFSSYLAAAIGVAKLAIGAAAGGGAGAAAAGASEVDVSQATSGAVDSRNISEQSILEYAFSNDPANGAESVTQPTKASFDGISARNITNVVGTVMGSKLHVEHSGSFSGNTGYLGIRRPYLIIQRPRMCMPNEYRAFNGYPSMITLNIGDCKGYTKVQQVQLKNIPATNPEQSEIMQLLKGGIII